MHSLKRAVIATCLVWFTTTQLVGQDRNQAANVVTIPGLSPSKSLVAIYFPAGSANPELAESFIAEDAAILQPLTDYLRAFASVNEVEQFQSTRSRSWQLIIQDSSDNSFTWNLVGSNLQTAAGQETYQSTKAAQRLRNLLQRRLRTDQLRQVHSQVKLDLRLDVVRGQPKNILLRFDNRGPQPVHILRSLPLLCLRVNITLPGGNRFVLADPFPTVDIAVPNQEDYVKLGPGEASELTCLELLPGRAVEGIWVGPRGQRVARLSLFKPGKYRVEVYYQEAFCLGTSEDELCARSEPAVLDVVFP